MPFSHLLCRRVLKNRIEKETVKEMHEKHEKKNSKPSVVNVHNPKKESYHSVKGAIESHHTPATNQGFSRKHDGGFYTTWTVFILVQHLDIVHALARYLYAYVWKSNASVVQISQGKFCHERGFLFFFIKLVLNVTVIIFNGNYEAKLSIWLRFNKC